jgi:hypothetical protein
MHPRKGVAPLQRQSAVSSLGVPFCSNTFQSYCFKSIKVPATLLEASSMLSLLSLLLALHRSIRQVAAARLQLTISTISAEGARRQRSGVHGRTRG